MKRLTYYHMKGSENDGYYLKPGVTRAEAIDRLAAYEDTGMMPEEVNAVIHALMGKTLSEIVEFDGVPIARLQELAQADKEGRVVVLPCKPGEYWRDEDGERVLIGTVSFCKTRNSVGTTDMVTYSYKDEEDDFAVNWIYFKSHFTRDEAEAALKGEGNG